MKNRVFAIVCNAVGIVCCGILLYAGIYDGKSVSAILYGLCFVCSLVSLILNVVELKKREE